MIISWGRNPLATKVTLDKKEVEILRLKIRIEELQDLMFSAHWALTTKVGDLQGAPTTEVDLEGARSSLDPNYYLEEKGASLDARVNELLAHYLEELNSKHFGDCTCTACSCSKCRAEDMLGIDTIKGLDKYGATKVEAALSQGRSYPEAIAWLENYDPGEPSLSSGWTKRGDWEAHLPRWRAEAASAAVWLKAYQEAHPEVALLALAEQALQSMDNRSSEDVDSWSESLATDIVGTSEEKSRNP